MFAACIVVTILAAAANIFSATLDFIRYKQILINMAKAGVPESWITMLGALKAAGALGLLVGIGVPLIGTAAAVGLVLFFVGAIITHLRARDYSFWSGGRVPPAGRGRVGIATGLVVSRETLGCGLRILARLIAGVGNNIVPFVGR
jgi:hypothetical protein